MSRKPSQTSERFLPDCDYSRQPHPSHHNYHHHDAHQHTAPAPKKRSVMTVLRQSFRRKKRQNSSVAEVAKYTPRAQNYWADSNISFNSIRASTRTITHSRASIASKTSLSDRQDRGEYHPRRLSRKESINSATRTTSGGSPEDSRTADQSADRTAAGDKPVSVTSSTADNQSDIRHIDSSSHSHSSNSSPVDNRADNNNSGIMHQLYIFNKFFKRYHILLLTRILK